MKSYSLYQIAVIDKYGDILDYNLVVAADEREAEYKAHVPLLLSSMKLEYSDVIVVTKVISALPNFKPEKPEQKDSHSGCNSCNSRQESGYVDC